MNGNDKKEMEEGEFTEDEMNHAKEDLSVELIEIESKLINEALSLVEQGLSLTAAQDYDDAIDIFRQALGLYDQIGRTNELNLIRTKISEINLLKKQKFQNLGEEQLEDGEPEIGAEESKSKIKIEEKEQIKSTEPFELLAKEKLEQAKNLIDIYEYDKALGLYDDAIELYRKLSNDAEVDRIFDLIDECYDQKARYLLKGPDNMITEPDKMITEEESEAAIKTTTIIERSEKLIEYEEVKLREELTANRAFELIEQASKFATIYDFDRAAKLYNEAINYFKEINWYQEIHKIEEVVNKLQKDKRELLKEVQERKSLTAKRRVVEEEKIALLEKEAIKTKELEEEEKVKRLHELEKKKHENEVFQEEISKKVDKAERISREYEQLIKRRRFDVECQYPEVIDIYSDILKLLNQKGWTDQVGIYKRQIDIYKKKLEQDKKLRKIEAGKIRKQKEYEESLKIRKKVVPSKVGLDSSKLDKTTYKDELTIEVFKKDISSMVDKAIRLAREYEFAVRRGNTEIKSPYPEIIEIYTKVRDMFLEKGLKNQAEIYNKQILFYKKKL